MKAFMFTWTLPTRIVASLASLTDSLAVSLLANPISSNSSLPSPPQQGRSARPRLLEVRQVPCSHSVLRHEPWRRFLGRR